MPRTFARVVSAVLAISALVVAAGGAAAADDGEGTDVGLVEIPFGEPGQIRPAEGWSIDCAALGALDGVELACLPDQVTLTAAYDPQWGERELSVPLRAGAAAADVVYRVRLDPPPPPEIAADAIDLPVEAGSQALIPLALLGVTCTLCAERPEIAVQTSESPGAVAGVSPTHLALRAPTPGVVTLAVTVTDDAGQSATSPVRVFVVAAGTGESEGPTALHVATGQGDIDLSTLAWGRDPQVSCLGAAASVTCSADGLVSAAPAEGAPRQVAFRAVDADGRQALGSVTIYAAGARDGLDGAPRPVAVSWGPRAPLGVTLPAPAGDAAESDAASPLSDLARILQEVPTP